MLRYGCLFALFSVLCGCMTPAERSARAQAELAEMIQVYGPACEKLGFTKETEPWRNCILSLAARNDTMRDRPRPSTTTCFGQQGSYSCTMY